MNKLKVRTLFSGIGAPEKALKDAGVDYELVDFCEFDKYAIKSYCAVHNESEEKNLGDITKVSGEDLPYSDMMVWGFPCQSISIAGKRAGIVEGETSSGLYYEGLRILKETMPKYSIIENVKNLTGKKFKTEFEQILKDVSELGYNNYWKVLNSKDFGIPQSRERVFIISIREDVDLCKFEFPEPFDNNIRLKDLLEINVDEKYYISEDKAEKLISQLEDREIIENRCNQVGMLDIKGNEQIRRVYSEEGLSPTLNTMTGGNRQPKVLMNTCIQLGSLDRKGYHEFSNRVYSPEGIARTLMGSGGNLNDKAGQYMIDYRIRRLTPRECWRLMGFSDEDFNKAQAAGISNSQLYKQAGNSIVTNVLREIFKNLLDN